MYEISKEEFFDKNLGNDAPTQPDLVDAFDNNISIKDVAQLQKFYKEDNEYQLIQKLRNVFKRKQVIYIEENGKSKQIVNPEFKFSSFQEFYWWYKKYNEIGTCCYCGVHKEDSNVNKIFDGSKRGRGRVLEIERVVTIKNKNIYSEENCRLSCHICNNAKSDFITAREFKYIALGINRLWQSILEKKIPFPTEVYDTFDS